ncbi:MAG: TonB family protein [Candidatus Firestonebacteria bacterium]
MNIFYEDRRIMASFLISFIFHVMILGLFGFFTIKHRKELKVIANINFIEPVMPGTPPGPPAEKPKNIWEFVKMALPTFKKPDFPVVKKEEKPIEVVKKELEKAMDIERKLVEKEDPLRRKQDALKFEELNKEKDQKLADLMKLTKGDANKIKELIEQERQIVDKGELQRESGSPLQFENEVGLKREMKVKDVLSDREREKIENETIKNLTPQDLLIERKEPIKEQKKAGFAGDDLGIKLNSKAPSDVKIKEIMGTKEERKKIRELLALEEKLVEKVPTRVASSGAGGGGEKPKIGYSEGGGGINIDKDETLKKMERKDAFVIKKTSESQSTEKVAMENVKKPVFELSGPLKDRGRIAFYMPKYPEWMKEKGIEADVSIRFLVSRDGFVRDEMTIETTSGYTELDKLVMTVLKQWQFEPLLKNVLQEDQWGIITFRFKLQ